MKNALKVMLLPFLAVMVMMSCDGFDKGKSQANTTPVSDKGVAFEVFQRIPKEDLDEKFQTKNYICPDDCTRHFGDSEGYDMDAELYEYNGNSSFSVDCFPLKDGGWLALLINETCFDGCEQIAKTYVYKDGVLHFVSDKLPCPTMDEMIVDPFIICGVDPDEIMDFRSEWDSRYLYYLEGSDTLSVAMGTLNYDDMIDMAIRNKRYAWDGESFVEIPADPDAYAFNIVDYEGLGGIKLGDTLPESIEGFTKLASDDGILYSRNGKRIFKTELDSDGIIEAINVYEKKYQHQGVKIGDRLNELSQKPGHVAYFKDGTFVVTDENGYDDYRIDYVGPADAIHGNFAEGMIAMPEFKPDATVQFIRLYRHHDWENDTCDMRALREAIGDPSLDHGDPTYGVNDFQYYREYYNDSCQGWCDALSYYLHCYPLKNGGFKVYETGNWQSGWPGNEAESGFSKFSAYIYKNGQLTEVEPEPELNNFPLSEDGFHFSSVMAVYFYDRTMTVATGFSGNGKIQGAEFTWDGTTMKKTFEGTFDN